MIALAVFTICSISGLFNYIIYQNMSIMNHYKCI